MTIENLDSWLKVAAENKITTKNTWDAPIIDHFTNIDEFRNTKGINFNKATTTLDGCVKVYSTRVDTVSDDTFKLLESIATNEEQKVKMKKKKGTNTIEKNVANLNIKISNVPVFNEPLFFRLKETVSILSVVKMTPAGLFNLEEEVEDGDTAIFKPYPFDASELFFDRFICPTLNEIDPSITDKTFVTYDAFAVTEFADEKNEERKEEADFDLEPIDNSLNEQEQVRETEEGRDINEMRGWAGPESWKALKKKPIKRDKKEKTKKVIDFSIDPNLRLLLEEARTIIDQKEVTERRSRRNTIPEDYRIKTDDLYLYLARDGRFELCSKAVVAEKEIDLSIGSINNMPLEAAPEEIQVDMKNVPNTGLSRKLMLRYRRVAKKVDIKKLQENVVKIASYKDGTSLKEIYKGVFNFYEEKESKDISVHYCFLSLLFLAHQKNVKIERNGSEITVKL